MAVDIIARAMAGSALKGSGSVPATTEILRGDGDGGIVGIPSEYVEEVPVERLEYQVIHVDKIPTMNSKNLITSGGVHKYLKNIPDVNIDIDITEDRVNKIGETANAKIEFTVKRILDEIREIVLKKDEGTAIMTITENCADGGSWTKVDSVTENHSYKVEVTDISGHIYTSDTVEVKFMKPTYYGFASKIDELSALDMTDADMTVITFNCEYDQPVFKWPKSRGALTSILTATDGYYYDNYKDSFELVEDGDYYIYTLKDACRLDAFSFCFLKKTPMNAPYISAN